MKLNVIVILSIIKQKKKYYKLFYFVTKIMILYAINLKKKYNFYSKLKIIIIDEN